MASSLLSKAASPRPAPLHSLGPWCLPGACCGHQMPSLPSGATTVPSHCYHGDEPFPHPRSPSPLPVHTTRGPMSTSSPVKSGRWHTVYCACEASIPVGDADAAGAWQTDTGQGQGCHRVQLEKASGMPVVMAVSAGHGALRIGLPAMEKGQRTHGLYVTVWTAKRTVAQASQKEPDSCTELRLQHGVSCPGGEVPDGTGQAGHRRVSTRCRTGTSRLW